MDKSQIQYLVFQGGGVKGIANGGALLELKKIKNFSLENIKEVAGTSVGAIIALAISLGISEEDIYQVLVGIDYESLADGTLIQEGINLIKEYGAYEGMALYKVILKIINDKIKNKTEVRPELFTFEDLHNLGFKNLHIVTTKMYLLNGVPVMKRRDFSYETTPNTPIAGAILASSAATPYFKSVRLKKDLTVPGRYVLDPEGDLYIDGGFKNNFPMDIFDKGKYIDGYCGNPNDVVPNPHSLGIALISTPLIIDENHPPKKERIEHNQPLTFIEGLAIGALGPVLYGEINDEYRERTIQIDTGTIKPFNLKISTNDKEKLVAAGKQAVRDFFSSEKQPSAVDSIVKIGKIWTPIKPVIATESSLNSEFSGTSTQFSEAFSVDRTISIDAI